MTVGRSEITLSEKPTRTALLSFRVDGVDEDQEKCEQARVEMSSYIYRLAETEASQVYCVLYLGLLFVY